MNKLIFKDDEVVITIISLKILIKMNAHQLFSILVLILAFLSLSRAARSPHHKHFKIKKQLKPVMIVSFVLLQLPDISTAASSVISFESRLNAVESKVDLLATEFSSLSSQFSSLSSQFTSLSSQFTYFQTTLFIALPLLIYIYQEKMMEKMENIRKADKIEMENIRKTDKEEMDRKMLYSQFLTIFILVLISSFTTGSIINTFFVKLFE